MATSIAAGGLYNAPIISEYEFLRNVYNSFLTDEDTKLPSAISLVVNNTKTGSDTADVAIEMGLPSAATTVAAKAMGQDRGLDVPGIRYSPIVETAKGSDSILDNFTAVSFAAKAGANAFVVWKTGGTDSEIKKLLTQNTTNMPQRVLNTEVFLPPGQGGRGQDTISIGKASESLGTGTVMDRVAKGLGTRSTEEVRLSREYTTSTEKDRTKNNEINHALQVFFDAKIRQMDKNEGWGLGGREGTALKRLESLGKKYPDEANVLAKIQSGWQNAVDKKKTESIIRRLRAAGPHQRKVLAEEWSAQTNREVVYK
jgi:hypothetical protein